MRFCCFRQKAVVNVIEGKQLGYVSDAVIDECTGRICSIIVPGCPGFKTLFRAKSYCIPWANIVKIGDDVILVEVDLNCISTAE